MSKWVRRPGPPHTCKMPEEFKYGDQDGVGAVWRCDCHKLWVFREGWWFGDFPPAFQRTVSQWHKARWWERLYWWYQNG